MAVALILLVRAEFSFGQEIQPLESESKQTAADSELVELRRFVILTSSATEQVAALAASLAGHLSDYVIDVEVVEISGETSQDDDWIQTVEQVLWLNDAAGGLWMDEDRQRLFLMVLPLMNERDLKPFPTIVERALQNADQANWQTYCEAISSFVRTAIEPWLLRKEKSPSVPPALPKKPQDDANTWPNAALFLQTSLHFDGPQWGWGLDLEIGLIALKYLQFQTELTLLAPIEKQGSAGNFKFDRIPIRIGAAARLPLEYSALALKFSFVTTWIEATGAFDTTGGDSANNSWIQGVAVGLSAWRSILRWLALSFDFGVDFYEKGFVFQVADGPEVHFYNVQAQVNFGLVFIVPV